MERLEQKWRPRKIEAFVGLEKPKRIFTNLLRRPRPCALLCEGETGLGKTAFGLAFADELPGSLIHVPAKEFTMDRIREIRREIHDYNPSRGVWWVILVDEVDQSSNDAQVSILSDIDGTASLHKEVGGHSVEKDEPQAVWIFTTNHKDDLEPRFIGRCLPIQFSKYGLAAAFADRLRTIWKSEAPDTQEPNYERIVKECNGNIRAAINRLDLLLLEA